MNAFLRLFKIPMFTVGFSIFCLLLFSGFILPEILKLFDVLQDPFAMTGMPFERPSAAHWMGTNQMGQDAFARLLYGLRNSMLIGVAAALIATTLGTAVGVIGGYVGGIVDELLTILTNLLVVVPQLIILILLINSVDNTTYYHIIGFIGITAWVWVARALRAQAASLRARPHVDLSKLNGYSTFKILIKQIVPYVFSYVFMAFIMQTGSAIFSEAALSMLGLGPKGEEVVSIGYILHNAKKNGAYTDGKWWVFITPTIVVTFTMYSLYLLNTSMEGVFNPRLRK